MASVAVIYRKDKLNKKGLAPVHFRIIKDRKISYISSGIMLPEDNWDFKQNNIKSKHRNSKRLNSFLSNKFTELQDQVFEHETILKSLTGRQLRDKIYGKKPTDFIIFADKIVEGYNTDDKFRTYNKNKSTIAKLKKYLNGVNISFNDVTPEFLAKYETHLKDIYNNSINTIHKDLKFFRKIFNDAYRQDIIEHHIIPFNKFKLKTEKTERYYLTEEELLQIENYKPTPGTRLELHKDMFVFAAYTGGVRVSDMLQIQWQHFDGININFTIKKTSSQISIKVPNKALELIDKYKPDKPDKNAFLFPMLTKEIDINNIKEVDKAISSATAYINKNLKIIAKKVGIEKTLSFHISRHTWATRALRKGISIDKVSKIMGHSAIKETQIYAKIVSSELDKAMEVFND